MKNISKKTGFLKASITLTIALMLIGTNLAVVSGSDPLNNPPDAPSSNYPWDALLDVDVGTYLRWRSSDSDGDTITYHVYFGDSYPPPHLDTTEPYSSGESVFYYFEELLNYGTIYYWNVTAVDEHGAATMGPDWSFTTEARQAPNTPNSPTPGDHASDVAADTLLKWKGGDTNQHEELYYHVYLGDSPSTEYEGTIGPCPTEDYKIVEFGLETLLDYGTTYYWNVTAVDEFGFSTPGPLWDFTTEANQLPNMPSNPEPVDGAVPILPDADLYWNGGDPRSIDTVTYHVYFGTSSPPPYHGSTESYPGDELRIGPYPVGPLDLDTTYYWNVTEVDNNGASVEGPIWEFHTARYTTLYVGGSGPDNYTTIQAALDDAWMFDTVYVYNGVYHEHLTVDKQVSLIGESKENVIVDGTSNGKPLLVNGANVTIDSVTLRNSNIEGVKITGDAATLTNCDIFDTNRALVLWSSDGHTLTNCDIYDNAFGFYFSGTEGNTFTDCNVFNNGKSIHAVGLTDNTFINCNFYGNDESGVTLSGNENTLTNCHAYNNGGVGIHASGSSNTITDCSSYGNGAHGIVLGSENIVENCEFTNNNDSGIFISGGENIITDCLIEGNLAYGIRIPGLSTEPGKGGNMIYHNNILNSEGSAENAFVDETDPARQTWDNDVNIGNFWDDHPGGNHSFGVYETEYRIGVRNKDRYPLVNYPYVPDATAPDLTILVPEEGNIYLRGKKFISLPFLKMAVIIGDITYEAEAFDESEIARVEFTYTTAGLPDHIDYESPYTWELNESRMETPDTPLQIRAVDTWDNYHNVTISTLVINLGIL
jgi:parallel beta-helix repeat protein